ncbi:aldehyde dehydrogenase family protein [Streptomyces sp. NPDC048277]|uniref:aldehyde dehydrogenase family protein n=1 Tax=Streptomyces sp. NPDC048277 TaxID=3155027 RepID=UPI0033EF7790
MTDASAGTLTSRSPQRPHEVVFTQRAQTPDDAAAAVSSARTAARAWAVDAPAHRAAALHTFANLIEENASAFTDLIVREVGKPLAEATGEVARAVAIVRYYAQQVFDPTGSTFPSAGDTLAYTRRRPHGAAALITPWNFPLAIPLWKAAPALAAGNGVVLKPSLDALGVADELARLARAALPGDLFQVVAGERETVEALIDAADVVSFTGSTRVGRSVAQRATARGIPVQAEMGGQNPAVVLPDADPEHTARTLLPAVAGYAGQKCTATRRIVVVGHDNPVLPALRTALAGMEPGDPVKPDTAVGPLIDEQAAKTFTAAVAEAASDGAEVLQTARPLPDAGWYVPPTLVFGLPAAHRLLHDEVFGPLAAVVTVDSVEEAVAAANDVDYGLVASVHGRDIEALLRVANQLEAGMVRVNAATTGVDFYMPFGGDKDSSAGPREQGKAALDFYTGTQTVTVAPGPRQTS